MRSHSVLAVSVLLVLGLLMAEAAVVEVPPKGQDTVKGPVLVKGQDLVRGQVPAKGHGLVKRQDPDTDPRSEKPGVCPKMMIRCAMLDPPNQCNSDYECPENKKCCEGFCGLACLQPL